MISTVPFSLFAELFVDTFRRLVGSKVCLTLRSDRYARPLMMPSLDEARASLVDHRPRVFSFQCTASVLLFSGYIACRLARFAFFSLVGAFGL